jgi:gliding motility-associated lipoprotein GldH
MNKIAFAFLLCFFLWSCTSESVYHQYKSLPGQWDKDAFVTFSLPQLDSLKSYDIFIHIRNNNSYKYSNLFLISDIQFPNGKVITDTLEYEMARPDGSWLGTGGSIKESKLWLKENIRFFEEGTYTISIQHAMRNMDNIEGVKLLEGITDVGLSIEENTNR